MKTLFLKLISLILIAASLTALTACREEDDEDGGTDEPIACAEGVGTGACEYKESRDVEGRDVVYVEMCVKGFGKMVIMLDRTTAPVTVDNFLKLVRDGFYDGLTFHRVMEGFMIQGGDPKADGSGGSDDEIVGEFSSNGHANDISHLRGVISMARTNDPDSATSQFFICNADSTFLDGNYAAFGYVVEGLSVVDAITVGTLPYTEFYEYYGTDTYYWLSYSGYLSGAIKNKDNQAVITHIRVLENYPVGN